MVYKSGQTFFRFVRDHACDGQTDGRTDGQTEFFLLYRVCITCSAVKMLISWASQPMGCLLIKLAHKLVQQSFYQISVTITNNNTVENGRFYSNVFTIQFTLQQVVDDKPEIL